MQPLEVVFLRRSLDSRDNHQQMAIPFAEVTPQGDSEGDTGRPVGLDNTHEKHVKMGTHTGGRRTRYV